MKSIDQAVKDAGGLSASAKRLGIPAQRLWNWIDRGVPLERVRDVCLLLGMDPWDFRPDDWWKIWPELVRLPGAPDLIASEETGTFSIVAARIREARLSAGLTQEALGHALGVSKAAVSQWEAQTALRTEPTLSNLRAIAISTKVTADFLLGLQHRTPAMLAEINGALAEIAGTLKAQERMAILGVSP